MIDSNDGFEWAEDETVEVHCGNDGCPIFHTMTRDGYAALVMAGEMTSFIHEQVYRILAERNG